MKSRAAFLAERGKSASALWRHTDRSFAMSSPFTVCFVSFHPHLCPPPPPPPHVPSGEVQYDIELVHNIEQYTGTPLDLCPEVVEEDVLKLLNQVAKASRVAKMRLMEQVNRW